MLSQTGEHGSSKTVTVGSLYRTILKNEGIAGLWAGNGANLLRIFPAKGVVFASNDYYRSMLRSSFFAGHNSDEPLPTYLGFISGGMSGITASAATYPLDFVRGRISGKLASPMNNVHYKGIWQTIRLTIHYEGFFALYKGITPTLLGAIPYEGIKFGTVSLCESFFPIQHGSDKDSNEKNKIVRKLIFGGLGGIMAGLITYPNDTVRRLLQLQGSQGTTAHFNGYWDCVRKKISNHGVKRLYNGVGINLIRMAPNTAVQFGSYELLKRITEDRFY